MENLLIFTISAFAAIAGFGVWLTFSIEGARYVIRMWEATSSETGLKKLIEQTLIVAAVLTIYGGINAVVAALVLGFVVAIRSI